MARFSTMASGLAVLLVTAAACGSTPEDATGDAAAVLATGDDTAETNNEAATETNDEAAAPGRESAGLRLVSAEDGATIAADPPADLVILDVRTPDEFSEGHLEGAVMLDFYEPDFADRLAELDPDVPYLLYCRSGNRSGQTAALMAQLGFTDVADVDGGILAWTDAGLPTIAG